MPTQRISKVEAMLPRIVQWCEHGRLSEKSLESLLLLDLFQDALKYDSKRATSQTPIASGIADIALRVHLADKKQWVVVEIKKPTVVITDDTVKQAARYLLDLRATRGIVTNGKVWLFIRVRPKSGEAKFSCADILFRLNIGKTKTSKESKLLCCALSRCSRINIHGFFTTLENFHDVGSVRIQSKNRGKPFEDIIRNTAIYIRSQSKTEVRQYNTVNKSLPKKIATAFASQDLNVLKIASKDMSLFSESML